MTRRVGPLTAVVALALVVATACSGDQPPATTVPADQTTEAAISTTSPVEIDPADDGLRTEALAAIRGGVAALLAAPAAIDVELLEEDDPVRGSLRIDPQAGLLDSHEERPITDETTIATDFVVVDGAVYRRGSDGSPGSEDLPFVEVPFDPLGRELLDEAYTAWGRLGPSLDRIVVLLEELPFAAATRARGETVEVSVAMDPFAIFDYYRETELELVGGEVPPQPSAFLFVIEDGVLRGLVAEGTHFHDGEALEISADLTYTPIEPFTLQPPENVG